MIVSDIESRLTIIEEKIFFILKEIEELKKNFQEEQELIRVSFNDLTTYLKEERRKSKTHTQFRN